MFETRTAWHREMSLHPTRAQHGGAVYLTEYATATIAGSTLESNSLELEYVRG